MVLRFYYLKYNTVSKNVLKLVKTHLIYIYFLSKIKQSYIEVLKLDKMKEVGQDTITN